ncbi:putative DNA polymerase [Holothuria leucospilota]|uniref:DNA-directed DNA polymerase n=1 Tax=Holothuria leucospilota TaxID=206669 RepID=A0A9Q1BA10_HOLLE|nr:putative DNA polymerase [Holothuria leucospilota]
MDSVAKTIQAASSFEELDEIIRCHQNLNENHREMLFQRMCWLATDGSPVTLSGAGSNNDDWVEQMFQESDLPTDMDENDEMLLEWLVTGGESEGLTDDEMLSAIPTLASPLPQLPQNTNEVPSDPPRREYVGRINEGASTSGLRRINEGASTSGLGKGQKRTYDSTNFQNDDDDSDDDEHDVDLDNVSNFYKIEKVSEKFVKKYNATSSDHFVKFNNLDKLNANTFPIILGKIIEQLIANLTDGMSGHDMVRIVISSEFLDTPIALPFVRKRDLSVERIMSHIEKILQSHEEIILDEGLQLNFIHLKMPCGGGKAGTRGGKGIRNPGIDVIKFLKQKRSIITIPKTEDQLCCARAIVTAIARKESHPKWEAIRKGCKIQLSLAKKLHKDAGIPEGPCGIDELKAFQKFLGKKYQIVVFSLDQLNEIIFKGEYQSHQIYLYYHHNHYDLMTSPSGFFSRSYYCPLHNVFYENRFDHKCENTCSVCYSGNCKSEKGNEWIHCERCNRNFKNDQCFKNHQLNSKGGDSMKVCDRMKICPVCEKFYRVRKNKNGTIRPHNCNEYYCRVCRALVKDGHQCYIQVYVDKKKREKGGKGEEGGEGRIRPNEVPHKYIFFDFETIQESGVHVPNLCVVQMVCDTCILDPFESECLVCKEKQVIFRGPNTKRDFCEWLLAPDRHNATCVAHNLKGFDGYFILQHLYDNGVVPKIITNGAKVMTIELLRNRMRFIDSVNFLPMPLANMPKTFGIHELKKGFFPHLFNTTENQSYVGLLPDASFFAPNYMREEKRKEFFDWYESEKEKGFLFDFQKELVAYCISDVDILRRCCLMFRSLFLEITAKNIDNAVEDHWSEGDEGDEVGIVTKKVGVDPFKNCITIASACNLVFRRNFLKPNTIAVFTNKKSHNYSAAALEWLYYESKQRGVYIKHAQNEGEEKIGQYFVDGFDPEGKIIFAFQGCFWHGCPKCFNEDSIHPFKNESMGEVFKRSEKVKKFFLSCEGYQYVEMWEHDWKELKKTLSQEMLNEIGEIPRNLQPLVPREAFFGGRTNGIKLYHEVNENEQIKYVDFCSLYPYTNKYCSYPLGHPKILTSNLSHDMTKYYGLVRCTILPPRRLFHPVLPVKIHDKLIFPLCRTCVEEKSTDKCNHSESQRALTGTWVTLEVQKAIEKGYEIKRVEVVWHFTKSAKYDRETKEGGLFTDYVNTFLKVKQEASGWPDWCVTEVDRQRYLKEYARNEGITLEPSKIEKNPGLRALAKLMLNSFWGKFGQREDLVKTEIVDEPSRLYDLMKAYDETEVKDVRFINDEVLEVHYKDKENFNITNSRVNVVIAAFTTCHARLRLYDLIDQLNDRVLYFDTDSVIYIARPGEWDPPTGDYLGDLTNEISPKDGSFIRSFVTGGGGKKLCLYTRYRQDCLQSAWHNVKLQECPKGKL